MDYEVGPTSRDTGHEDKAAVRRVKRGSDNPYQRDEAPASVHRFG